VRQISGKDVKGEILEWKEGKIIFNPHRWHATEAWEGTRLVLAGYTIAGLDGLSRSNKGVLVDRGFIELRTKLEEILVEHAGGDQKLDRIPFEMAAKGEAGCGLVKWKLEMGPLDVAQSWKANYESAEENLDFVREHFETEVAEGLMIKMREADFWAEYGDEAAISAIAVIVEEGPPAKRRVVHDASHD
ncbi:unnamed protein product, partial [Symbiodinium necroappetens]